MTCTWSTDTWLFKWQTIKALLIKGCNRDRWTQFQRDRSILNNSTKALHIPIEYVILKKYHYFGNDPLANIQI